MEIILLQDVPNLGDKDDVVKVKPGYANNFLIPQGMATVATVSAKKVLSENLRQAAHRMTKMKDEASQRAAQLTAIELKVPTLVGKEGKIYGSITTLQISNLLKEKGFDIDRRKITFDQDIKTTGTYTARINLHKEVKAELKFDVIEKEEE